MSGEFGERDCQIVPIDRFLMGMSRYEEFYKINWPKQGFCCKNSFSGVEGENGIFSNQFLIKPL
jgi:hypothetical protein